MTMRAFDRSVLMCQAPIVAGRLHAVMRAQCVVAPRLILPRAVVEIAEGSRETVAAMQRAFEGLLAGGGETQSCRTTVGLLALAHDRACEAELAAATGTELNAGRLPDLDTLDRRFAAAPGAIPDVTVAVAP